MRRGAESSGGAEERSRPDRDESGDESEDEEAVPFALNSDATARNLSAVRTPAHSAELRKRSAYHDSKTSRGATLTA
eukprot:349848-Pleurochrysis_carterae.AAC.4